MLMKIAHRTSPCQSPGEKCLERLHKLLCLAPACLVLLMLWGCATPETRIRKNPELFASFTGDVQAKVRRGRIDLGFSRDMARMALGPPHRVHTRISKEERTEVWAYISTYFTYDRFRGRMRPIVKESDGECYYPPCSDFWEVEHAHEFEALRLEFSDDKVTVIEKLDR